MLEQMQRREAPTNKVLGLRQVKGPPLSTEDEILADMALGTPWP